MRVDLSLVAGLFFHMLTQLFLNRAVIASGACGASPAFPL